MEMFRRYDEDLSNWIYCLCGNNPELAGFHCSYPNGKPGGSPEDIHSYGWPPEGWEEHQTITCGECGRFGRQTEMDSVTGAIPVRGHLSVLSIGNETFSVC
jgi:hypothetical protein